MRNLAAKVPEDVWLGFNAPATATDQTPSQPIARELAEGLVKRSVHSFDVILTILARRCDPRTGDHHDSCAAPA
jgi:hypothetical protein